jgi:hypothetical protein
MKNTIHYAFILDQSGSMSILKKVVVDSFNEQVRAIRKLKKENPDSEIKCTWCVFNDKVEFRFSSVDADHLKKIKPEDYQPGSYTALYDAIGATFKKIEKEAGPDDQVFFAVFTDGMENASTHFSAKDINKKLAKAEKKGWKVRFFCRLEEGAFYRRNLHLQDDNIMNITLNEAGMRNMDNAICCCLREMVTPYDDRETPEGILE